MSGRWLGESLRRQHFSMVEFERVNTIPTKNIYTAPDALAAGDFRLDQEAVQTVVEAFVTEGTTDIRNFKIVGTLRGSNPQTMQVDNETIHYLPIMPRSVETAGPRSLTAYNRIAVQTLGEMVAEHSTDNGIKGLYYEQRAPRHRKLRIGVVSGSLGFSALTLSGAGLIAGEATNTTEYITAPILFGSFVVAAIKSLEYAAKQPRNEAEARQSAEKRYREYVKDIAGRYPAVLVNKE